MSDKTFLPLIQSMLYKSGKFVLSRYRSTLTIKQKADPSQIVTEVDVASEKLIIKKIHERFPDHSIIAEESGFLDKKSPYTWIIDPIDGTSNFARGIPWFGVMVAVLKNSEPIASGIYLPVSDELYIAELGKGAFMNGKKFRVQANNIMGKCLISYGVDATKDTKKVKLYKGVFAKLVEKAGNIRSTNSAVDYAYVTDGKLSGVINFKNKIWDVVPVTLIAKEAGCIVTDHMGKALNFLVDKKTYTKDYTLVVAPKTIHKKLLKMIEQSK